MKKLVLWTTMVIVSLIFLSSSTNAGYYSTKLDIRENKLQIKWNKVDFRQEYVGTIAPTVSSLSQTQKQEIKSLQASFEAEVKILKAKIYLGMGSTEREDVYSEMKEVLAEYYGRIEYIVTGNTAALHLVQDRYTLFQKNEELRENSRQSMYDYVNDLEELFWDLENI